jgi:uncharacterized protein with PQ loop repeat
LLRSAVTSVCTPLEVLAFMLVALLGYVAAAVGITCNWPQIARLIRTHRADGVSRLSASIGVTSVATWLTYGVLVAQGPHIAANAPALLMAIATLVVLLRAAPVPGHYLAAGLAAWLIAVGIASTLGGVVAVSLLATCLGLVKQVPQLWTALRGDSITGLSPHTLALVVLSASLWTSYALAVGDPVVAGCSIVAIALNSAIMMHRVPPRWALQCVANGRYGSLAAELAAPVARRFALAA